MSAGGISRTSAPAMLPPSPATTYAGSASPNAMTEATGGRGLASFATPSTIRNVAQPTTIPRANPTNVPTTIVPLISARPWAPVAKVDANAPTMAPPATAKRRKPLRARASRSASDPGGATAGFGGAPLVGRDAIRAGGLLGWAGHRSGSRTVMMETRDHGQRCIADHPDCDVFEAQMTGARRFPPPSGPRGRAEPSDGPHRRLNPVCTAAHPAWSDRLQPRR